MAHRRIRRDEEQAEREPVAALAAPPAHVAAVLALQRTAGNHATGRVLARTPYEELKKSFEGALKEMEYADAAKFLNGFQASDITAFLSAVSEDDLWEIFYESDPYPTLQPLLIAEMDKRDQPAATPAEGKPSAAPADEAKPASADKPKFTHKKFAMSEKNVTLVGDKFDKDKKKTHSKVEETPKTYTYAILKNAGIDPADWYSKFTSITFLGVSVPDIHDDLATHLKDVEKKLAKSHGGAKEDPVEAGKALGITESMAGGRAHPTSAGISMHLFGLAIDVNYTANPFIAQKLEKGQPVDNQVFKRAGQLVRRNGDAAWKSGMSYADLSALDKILEDYFACIDDDAKLQAALKDNENGPWKGMEKAKAKTQIEADLTATTTRWERRKPDKKGADTEVIKKGGFMDLQEDFVKGIGLSWGASYGDVMHFDMRNKGRGATIQGEVGKYKKEKEDEAMKKAKDEADAAK